MLIMITNVEPKCVHPSIVRVGLLPTGKSVVLLDKMGSTWVKRVSCPKGCNEVSETSESADVRNNGIGNQTEGDVDDFPLAGCLLHGGPTNDIHGRIETNPKNLGKGISTNELDLPFHR